MTETYEHQASPGSARAAAASAASQYQADQETIEAHQAAVAEPVSDVQPVPVSHAGPQPVYRVPARHGNYSTILIAASTATVPAVARLLPRDDERVIAYVLPIDGPIVIASSKEQAQDPANVIASVPSGGYAPVGGYPVTHREEVWAANVSTSTTCRVAVMIETGGGAA
jgi:hypothetical protein